MIKKIAFWLLSGLLFGAAQYVLAVPAAPWPVEKIQPDGSRISVYLRGDEKVHWMESIDGYTLMYDENKYIVYAEQDNDQNLVPSNRRLSPLSIAPQNLKKGLSYSPSQVKMLKQIWEIADAPQKASSTTGSRKALVVLMGFPDRPFTKTKADFELLFNQLDYNPADGSAKGSVRDFFRENSYNQLDLVVTLAGPYVTDNQASYYASDSGKRAFAAEAARKADPDVDFNEFADDGTLETFHIIFAGHGAENGLSESQYIWSHKWALASPITLDGVRIYVYSCSPELRGSGGTNITYVGVVCHELTHVFGAPDYYDTDGGTAGNEYVGSGEWDLMANGSWNDYGRQPAHINMFQKILFGWVTPTPLTTPTEIPAMPPSAKDPVAYTIEVNNNGEMYVLENRQKVGFDASLPGHGLLIWHVHPSALKGNGSNATHPQQFYPVVASSTYQIPTGSPASYGAIDSDGAPFPGSAGKTALSARTTPAMFTWTGPQTISRPLTEIAEGANNTVSFKFMSEPAEAISGLQANVTNGTVKLDWTAPAMDALGYEIYRDGVLIYTINNKATTSYTQNNVPNGTYIYGVSAFYTSSQAEAVTVSVTVSAGDDNYYFPISNLKGVGQAGQVSLTWDAPFSGGWMTIAGGPHHLYSFNTTLTFFAGTLWGPDQLKGMDGYKATQIQFYLRGTSAGMTYKVQVWEVNALGVPVRIRSQDHTGLTEGYKIVTLNDPVVIDETKEYLIGVEVRTVANAVCLVTDSQPTVPGRNFISINNEWGSFEGEEIEGNLCASVFLDPGVPSSAPVLLDSRAQQPSESPVSPFLLYNGKTKTNLPRATKTEDVFPSGNAFSTPGENFSTPGENFSTLGENFSTLGENSSTPGENFSTLGENFSTLRENSSTLRENFSTLRENSSPSGNAPQFAPAVVRYAIFRNSEKIAETTERSYIDTGLASATTYSYCVSAIYSNGGVSEGVCTEATTLVTVNPNRPVENMTATLNDNRVELKWEAPSISNTFGYYIPSDTIWGFNLTGIMAIRIPPAELKKLAGLKLTEVSFFVSSSATTATTSYYINIYSGGDGATPGPSLLRQNVSSFRTSAWNRIPLTSPIDIDVYKDLWIGIETAIRGVSGGTVYRMSTDNRPATDGQSNLLYRNSSWTTLSLYNGSNYNWNILAYAGGGATPDNYRISRNGIELALAPSNSLTYTDNLPAKGLYTYAVSALYPSGRESDPAVITVPYGVSDLPSVSTPSTLTAYPNPVKSGDVLTIQTSTPGLLLRLHSLSGTLVQEQASTGLLTTMRPLLRPGVYILSAGEERVKVVVR